MRSADESTLIRIALVLLVIFLVIIKFNPIISILILALAFVLDGVDGFLALGGKQRCSYHYLCILNTHWATRKMQSK